LNNSTFAERVPRLFPMPSARVFVFTFIPLAAHAALYNYISSCSSPSESDSSSPDSYLSINISRQRGSLPTSILGTGLNKVFLGIFFLPLRFLRLIILALFF